VAELVSVTFITQHGSYNAGDVAVFPAAKAAALVSQRRALPTQIIAAETPAATEPPVKETKTVAARKGGRRG